MPMNYFKLLIVFLTLSFALPLYTEHFAEAAPASRAGKLGLGAVFGDPTGLSGKYWLAPNRAADLGLAFSFNDYFIVFGDYLFHVPRITAQTPAPLNQISPYIGIGAVLLFSTDDRNRDGFFDADSSVAAGLRLPLGLEWSLPDPPLGIFLEIAPGMGILPGTHGFVQGGIGLRYYF